MTERGRKLLRWSLWLACGVALVAVLGDWFDSPEQKAAAATRKCGFSLEVNMMGDAERYCATALGIAERTADLPPAVLAQAYTQAAALSMRQFRVNEAVARCRIAIRAWDDVAEDHLYRERLKSIAACTAVISAAKGRTS